MPATTRSAASKALNALAELAASTARSKGFHDVVYTPEQAATIASLALITTEVSEALDVYRKDGHHRSPEFAE